MKTLDNCSLRGHNTFGIDAQAAHFVEYDSVDELQMFVGRRAANGDTTPLLHIGGGSNLLFLGDYAGAILHSTMRDITVTANEGDYVYVRVSAGIIWDDWVQYAVDSHWHGLENLSAIPGEVGAAAVQNIGAYGSEAKDFILFVDTVDLETGAIRHFTNEECHYGYRDSIFKNELRGRYAVTHVHFRLTHDFRPRLDASNTAAYAVLWPNTISTRSTSPPSSCARPSSTFAMTSSPTLPPSAMPEASSRILLWSVTSMSTSARAIPMPHTTRSMPTA